MIEIGPCGGSRQKLCLVRKDMTQRGVVNCCGDASRVPKMCPLIAEKLGCRQKFTPCDDIINRKPVFKDGKIYVDDDPCKHHIDNIKFKFDEGNLPNEARNVVEDIVRNGEMTNNPFRNRRFR